MPDETLYSFALAQSLMSIDQCQREYLNRKKGRVFLYKMAARFDFNRSNAFKGYRVGCLHLINMAD